ncbi:formin-binding protein [Conoideocrella luteorostrata]|uniref:Formin-binding protein n=1 Tax=Conoideocrella luteorostrata TaxID=1105319 RepID=A0AAJ0FU04_9HYPO|nr:formin-binding protein [Conoideocrella luteorostrata]
MPAATAEVPAVTLSFANNFWGKEDAGVGPLLERMQSAKTTCDELKSFYSARASIEDEYSRKLLNLCRKSLGSQEMGTLKTSLDTVRGEVEGMAKQHQSIAAQMKTELEEPLAAFAGGMKERRKIVQGTVEKLLKTKIQQTQQVNKTRDKYEQECLKIKGYLAQGHMVMGQEERRNKAKLEKTQISLATANQDYESAVKVLEETTARWNREWKAAADKFQDLEEERLDFTKSSIWTFANIASTVCVSDDASCEKIRLSLEHMEVEKDIINFITERGTGQEIPDPPKYINFCRGDVTDSQSEVSEDENYSVAQFPRSINPAFRSSSPQPSTFESHHDPNSMLANNLAHREQPQSSSRDPTMTPQKAPPSMRASIDEQHRGQHVPPQYDANQHGPLAAVPHDPYPMDGMTMLCRTGPSGPPSDRSSQPPSARPSSRASHSDCSNPTSMSSVEPLSRKMSPAKQDLVEAHSPEKRVLKKKSGFFQNHSPFRRKSTKEVQAPAQNRNTWHVAHSSREGMDRTASPEPIDVNTSLALGVGQNVLPVTTPETQRRRGQRRDIEPDQSDPIALALAELKEVNLGKQSSVRMSADHYHGIATPAPGAESRSTRSGGREAPPSYNNQGPVSRLGVPPPAVTSRAMKEATKKATDHTRAVFGNAGSRGASPASRPVTRDNDMPRAASPAPIRTASPQPRMSGDSRYRSASPNPYSGQHRNGSQASMSQQRGHDQRHYGGASPHGSSRGGSPASYRGDYDRSRRSYGGSDMAVQLAPVGNDGYGSQRGRGAVDLYDGGSRPRSKSVADPSRQYTRDGRPILHFGKFLSIRYDHRIQISLLRANMPIARALYMYQPAIPEELGFAKGDYLAVLRHQDDGWWEAEVHNGNGQVGLVPSNYLQPC